MNSEELYNRLLTFARSSQTLTTKLSRTIYNIEYSRQIIRSSSSPGANYIEAIEASSKSDFVYRLKVCKKETKETVHWLNLIAHANSDKKELHAEINNIANEANELIKIFASSIETAKSKMKNEKC